MKWLNKKGFTLLELLVVVLIIGILSTIALPQYRVAVEKSKAAEAMSLIAPLKQAIDLHVLANGYNGVELVGTMGEGSGNLDIDIESVMDCSLDDGDRCFSNNFSYDAYCTSNKCIITANRQSGLNDSEKYGLGLEKTDNGWKQYCYTIETDIGRKVCRSLEGQGWQYHEGWW